MIFLWIFLGIVLFVLSVLFMPIHLVFDYRGEQKVYFRILFLRFDAFSLAKRFLSGDKEKKEVGKPGEKPKKKSSPVDLLGFAEFLIHLAEVIRATFIDFFSKASVNLKELRIAVGTDDAARTAMLSAGVSQAANGLCAVLSHFSHFRCNPKKMSIQPNFTDGKSSFSLHLDLCGSLVHMIGVYLRANIRFFELD